ncbi:MAG: hypothetical protein EON60_13460 [Alphaproteobacteria bacterium]|nr:MAG: hypothetical protein EON60_13460 [Alphaproteobacteria bacterium]
MGDRSRNYSGMFGSMPDATKELPKAENRFDTPDNSHRTALLLQENQYSSRPRSKHTPMHDGAFD